MKISLIKHLDFLKKLERKIERKVKEKHIDGNGQLGFQEPTKPGPQRRSRLLLSSTFVIEFF
ncbi:unnamed protein product [Larinioides sclopetarius]|uniref:Uncharacterized protein n=1 Tax=Larinioides sclopetarius TaxID=280406 RepID=A0AAV2C1H5_9ARAC